MAQTVHSTFTELTDAAFDAHADTMVANSKTAQKKREAIAYLWSVCSTDKKTLAADRKALNTKRLAQQKRQDKIEELLTHLEFDFSKSPELFTAQTLSDADMVVASGHSSKTVYIGGKSYTGDLTISGSNVTFDGEGHGLAVDETLTNTASIVGDLIITGENITIRNIDFTSSSNEAVRVAGAKNVTLIGCKFAPGAGLTDTKWFYGDGIQSGNVTIENCFVSNFDSWYLMDASTTSAVATVRLDQVKLIKNYFKNNHGSIAIRGPVSDPNKYVQVTGNRFETTTFHQLFWDFCEVSGATKRIVIQDNVCIGEPGTHTSAGKKGGFQIWSKSPQPWSLYFKGNSGQNMKVFLKIAHNSAFYSANTFDEEHHHIEFDKTLVDVAHCFSPVYKKEDGTTASANKWQEGDYVPINSSTYVSVPSVINPNSYSVVAPS